MKNIKIKTIGMHCPSCEMLVKDSLEDEDGISKAQADHKSGLIEVEFDDSKINTQRINQIIKEEGYEIK
jgi:copper chaperone CopZ